MTASEEETQAVAREFSTTLRAGDVLLVSGDLGAGKTTFVRGLATGLGINPREVSSPTFTIVHEYRGSGLTLYHADLYRLERAGWVAVRWDTPERGVPRKYYRLTDVGRAELERMTREWTAFANAMTRLIGQRPEAQ